MGVGNGSDFAIGVLLQKVQRETAPAAPQVDYFHPIFDGRALAIQIQHGRLRRLQLLRQTHLREGDVVGPQAGGVLLIRPEAQIVETGGDLVVLLVGQLRVDGAGHVLQFAHDAHFLAHVAFDSFVFELQQRVTTSDADGVAEEEVGEEEPREFGVHEGQAEVGEAGGQGGEVAGEVGLQFGEVAAGGEGGEGVVAGVQDEEVVGPDVVVGPAGGNEEAAVGDGGEGGFDEHDD